MSWATSDRSARLPADWPKRRAAVALRAGGQCEHVEDNARCALPGSECDHVVRGDDHSFDNLQWLCEGHHRTKTQAEAAEARRLEPRRRPAEAHPGMLS